MKKSTFLALTILFTLLQVLSSTVHAQEQRFGDLNAQRKQQISAKVLNGEKCGTQQWLNAALENPAFRLRYAENERILTDAINRKMAERRNNPNANRTEAIVTIPIVFHVVMNAAGQTSITDAKIMAQFDTLNRDYSGLNADSVNIPAAFQAVRGHSNIRFCMAQRTPNDLPTNGINRVTSGTVSNGNPNNDPIKSTAAGGADAWDPTRYLNVWLCAFSDPQALGYATFPIGTPEGAGIPLNQQGVAVLAQSIPGGTAAPYNKGRTLTHEAGHFFWMRHVNGDGTCGDDFPGTPGIDDTPQQSDLTGGCPTGTVTSGCAASPNPPGRMYQNFMDYTDDACMTMFTIGQDIRAEMALNQFRLSLTTSNGCTPPPAAAGNDSRISNIINPANGSTTGCASTLPVVTIFNSGSNTLTSATINVRLNGTLAYTQPWSGSLAQGASANVNLNTAVTYVTGTNTLKIHTTNPNGQTDAIPANDTSTSVVTKIAPVTLPVVNTFETALLPAGWSNNNPNGDALGWFRFNPGAGGSAFSAVMDNYSFDLKGTVDDIVTPVISTTGLLANDSLLLSFDLAHKNFPDAGFEDSLKVLVSTNCGVTWTTVWTRGDPELATAGSDINLYNPPAASDWRTIKPAIGNNLFGGGQIMVAFRNVNGFGNTMWLDNINIVMKPRKDMQTTAIVRPNPTECAPPFIPSITVRNNGGETVTAFKTGYILNNGNPVLQAHSISLAPGASTTVTFPSLTPPGGNNTIKMFITDPVTASVGPDGTPANDTLTRVFAVPTTVTNVIQGFEGTTFIPSGWTIFNANNNVTWIRKAPGKSSDFSAFIDNYNNNTINQLDIMQPPPVNTAGADSVIISFDVSHKDYPGSLDRLRVLVSTNCGVSFTSVYSKSGPTLATAGESDLDFTTPAQNEWRNEVIRLDNTFTGGNLLVQFENRNDFGNNIFVDNINIAPKYKRDIEVRVVNPDVACTANYAPVATVYNRGTEAVTAFTIAYVIGTGTPVIQNVTAINLAPGASMNVTLTAGNLAVGPNNIKVYTSAPVTTSGTGDQYLANDTLAKVSYAAGTVTAPNNIVETFEGGFIPSGWAVANADNALTWQKAATGKNSNGSAYLRNFTYYSNGQKDALYTPVLSFTGVDSVKVSFDLSAATRTYPGSTVGGLDTLEVLATKDCGATFTTVYKKWGAQLQTVGDPNNPQLTEFDPSNNQFLWRKESIDLTSFAPNGPLQLVFRNTTNNQNNIYIDNVNFKTVTLPSLLKSEGVIITPNPFSEKFDIWFVQPPSDLRYVTVLNSAGRLIWNKTFTSGSTSNIISVDLTGKSAGVYIVNLGFTSKGDERQIKIIKSN